MGLLDKTLKVLDSGMGFLDSLSGRSQQEDANKMAMKSWQLANDYNHPIQQMERLKLAGLNPNLVYGSGSVAGNTTGAPSLTGGGILTPTQSMFKGLNDIVGSLQGKANLDSTRAQTQASTAAAGASAAQASNLNAQTAINEAKAGMEEKLLIADLDYKKAQTDLIKQQTKKTSAEADISQGNANLFGAIGGLKNAGLLLGAGAKAGKLIGKSYGLVRGLIR